MYPVEEFYCLPLDAGDRVNFDEATRIENVDRYGGIGTGQNGGSGRCSTFAGFQTKGVGRTPLAATHTDIYHSSGVMSLQEACHEAIFSSVYEYALPHGAVASRAVVLTGEIFIDPVSGQKRKRALLIRDFVSRPAHFLRNLYSRESARPDPENPGWSHDVTRCQAAMRSMAENFKSSMPELAYINDEAEVIDAALRGIALRYSSQVAAAYAKRLPHGTISCSNIGLAGQFLDFGVASYMPGYVRIAKPPLWQESGTAIHQLARTLISLRQQLNSYHRPEVSLSIVPTEKILKSLFENYHHRLSIEMLKMVGLAERMATIVPSELSLAWGRLVEEIIARGAGESFVSYPGYRLDTDGISCPSVFGRYDAFAVFEETSRCGSSEDLHAHLTECIDDPSLVHRYVKCWMPILEFLVENLAIAREELKTYISVQGTRRRAELGYLHRTRTHEFLSECEDEPFIAGRFIDACVERARFILEDSSP